MTVLRLRRTSRVQTSPKIEVRGEKEGKLSSPREEDGESRASMANYVSY